MSLVPGAGCHDADKASEGELRLQLVGAAVDKRAGLGCGQGCSGVLGGSLLDLSARLPACYTSKCGPASR